nr:UPF0262 family protein [Sinorhizobium fredii]
MYIQDNQGKHLLSHHLALAPFRRMLKDYTRICDSYYDAIRRPGPERLEAIDMSRRRIHNEAAELLRDLLSSNVRIDNEAARMQPVRDGFINAVQVYPFAIGALYQVYAAPG